MTNDEMRIAVDRALGIPECDSWTPFIAGASMMKTGTCSHAKCRPVGLTANYPEDLNACAEMEKALTPQQEEDYVEELKELIMADAYEDCPRYNKSNLSSVDSTYRCTAPQRCEAFLRVKGLWRNK